MGLSSGWPRRARVMSRSPSGILSTAAVSRSGPFQWQSGRGRGQPNTWFPTCPRPAPREGYLQRVLLLRSFPIGANIQRESCPLPRLFDLMSPQPVWLNTSPANAIGGEETNCSHLPTQDPSPSISVSEQGLRVLCLFFNRRGSSDTLLLVTVEGEPVEGGPPPLLCFCFVSIALLLRNDARFFSWIFLSRNSDLSSEIP